MKLTELDPRWTAHIKGQKGQGIIFLCPHCKTHFIGIHFANPLGGGPALAAPSGSPNPERWERTGDTFDTLSIIPSIDAKCWHGFITNGEVTTV
jgi:hypothetical protein